MGLYPYRIFLFHPLTSGLTYRATSKKKAFQSASSKAETSV